MAILAHAPVIRSGGHQRTVVAGHLPDHRAEQALRLEPGSLLLDRPRVVKRPPLATGAGVAVRRDGLFVVVDRQVRERGYQVVVATGTGLLGELARRRTGGRLPLTVLAARSDALPATAVERQPDRELARVHADVEVRLDRHVVAEVEGVRVVYIGIEVAGVAGAVGLPRVVAAGAVEVVALDVREVHVVEDAGVAVLGGDVPSGGDLGRVRRGERGEQVALAGGGGQRVELPPELGHQQRVVALSDGRTWLPACPSAPGHSQSRSMPSMSIQDRRTSPWTPRSGRRRRRTSSRPSRRSR